MADLIPLEAYDLIRFAEVFEERLVAARDDQSRRRGLEREKRWLGEALELVQEAREGAQVLLDKSRDLPELADVREEFAEDLQQVWVDSLERLHAGITFHAGSRAPLIETLFPHLKFPQLRKAARLAVEQYAADLERRAGLAYVTRILGQELFAFAPAVIEQVRGAYAKWASCFSVDSLGAGDPEIRQALLKRGKAVDLALKQARMLAEAALTPVRGAYDESNLAAKPRKRTPRLATALLKSRDESSEDGVAEEEAAPAEDDAGDLSRETSDKSTDESPGVTSGEATGESTGSRASASPDAPPIAPARKRGSRKSKQADAPKDA